MTEKRTCETIINVSLQPPLPTERSVRDQGLSPGLLLAAHDRWLSGWLWLAQGYRAGLRRNASVASRWLPAVEEAAAWQGPAAPLCRPYSHKALQLVVWTVYKVQEFNKPRFAQDKRRWIMEITNSLERSLWRVIKICNLILKIWRIWTTSLFKVQISFMILESM